MVKSGNFGNLKEYKEFKSEYFEFLGANRFTVCLSHDVDNIKKRHQYITRFLKNPKSEQIRSFFGDSEPYWNFEEIIKIERSYGIKSTFFFLCQLSQSNLLETIINNKESKRYNLHEPSLQRKIRELDSDGWEIGTHGSFHSYRDYDLLKREKTLLEETVGHQISGIRQHYLNLKIPNSWEIQRKCGFTYDSSFGLNKKVGFKNDMYYPFNPLQSDFIVIPVTIMDAALFGNYDKDEIWDRCYSIIKEASENRAVLNVLWHQESFSESDFPFYTEIYKRIIETSFEADAKIITLGELSESILVR